MKFKQVTVNIILFLFLSIWTNGINFADTLVRDPIAKAEQLFNDMQYDESIKTLEEFIKIYKLKDDNKSNISYKMRLAKAYSLLARIYFSISESEYKEKIRKNIESCLKYDIDYKVETANKDFEKKFNNHRDEYLKNNPEIIKSSPKKILDTNNKKRNIKKAILRSYYINLTSLQAKSMIKSKGFRDGDWNKNGGFNNKYKPTTIIGDKVIIDKATNLMWHQSGSLKKIKGKKIKKWLKKLNINKYAGYSDWRLPTLEEAASLIENKVHRYGKCFFCIMYINGVFSNKQIYFWTGDSSGSKVLWVAHLLWGSIERSKIRMRFYIRPVRSINSPKSNKTQF